jgi:hypothetical protein
MSFIARNGEQTHSQWRVRPEATRNCEQIAAMASNPVEIMMMYFDVLGQVLDGFECLNSYKND